MDSWLHQRGIRMDRSNPQSSVQIDDHNQTMMRLPTFYSFAAHIFLLSSTRKFCDETAENEPFLVLLRIVRFLIFSVNMCFVCKSRIRYPSQMMVSSTCWVGLRHLGREMQCWIAFHYSQASATARCNEFSIFMYFQCIVFFCQRAMVSQLDFSAQSHPARRNFCQQ